MSAHAGSLQLSGWRGLFLLLMLGGAAAAFLGIRFEFATTSQPSAAFPLGLCFGLDVFCGIALATGALTISLVAYLIGGPEWGTVGRAGLMMGFLGYLVAIVGSLADGTASWHVLIRGWSTRSLLSGAAWTVLLLALLLFLEFLPQHSLRTARRTWFVFLSRLDLPLLILVTILAVVHQFELSRLIRLSETTRFSPLWVGPSLSSLFYLSSVVFGLAVLLLASWRSLLAFRKTLPARLQPVLARLLTAAVFVYLVLRLLDLMERGLFWSIFTIWREGLLLLLEVGLLLCGMLWIHGSETQPRELFIGSALVVLGVISNRLNTAITAVEAGMRQSYLPHWTEFLVAFSLIGAGVAGFAVAVKHLALFADLEA